MSDIAYISQSDVEKYLNISMTDDGVAQFNLMQPLLQDVIDQYCNRSWNFSNPVTENFDALKSGGVGLQANYTFFVKYPKISSVAYNPAYPLAGGIHSVKVGNSYIDMNYVVNYGTHVQLSATFPSIILANPLGFKMVEIIYESEAASECPKAVKMAFIMWMARVIQESGDAGKEVQQGSAGTVKVVYTPDKMPGMPNFVKLVLDNYRLNSLDRF